MLTPIVAPTSRRLLSPETVLARLKLPDSELDDLAELVDEVSGLVARYLRFEPAYGTWLETFENVRNGSLDLGARPAWGVTSILDRAGTPMATNSYRLKRGPYGESSIVRSGPWGYPQIGPFLTGYGTATYVTQAITGSLLAAIPDWTVSYSAGWWLEEMGPTPPEGVEPLPPEIGRDFLQLIRYFRATAAQNPTIYTMENDGMKVVFLHRKDQVLDEDSGLPTEALFSLAKYRRAG